MLDRQPRPRDLIDGSPGQFGFQPNAQWRQPTTLGELVRLRHAEIQHEFAFRVRMHIRERGLSQARFLGTAMGQPNDANWFPKDHFGRGINGTARFTLDQLLRIEQHSGPILNRLKFPKTVLTNPALIQAVPHADNVDHDVYRQVHGRPHPQSEPPSEPGQTAVLRVRT